MIKELISKNKEIINYIICGVLTTLINLVSFHIFNIFNINLYVSVGLAWFLSVIFAFVSNKIFVFESDSWKINVLGKEMILFLSSRIFSLGIDLVAMGVMVDILCIDEMIAKIISNVIVAIINYGFNKFVIFKK